MLTEDQAKTKWCPHAIASHTDPRAKIHPEYVDVSERGKYLHACIGTACMAWRWSDSAGPMLGPNGFPIEADPDPAARRGYCGLAGQVTP